MSQPRRELRVRGRSSFEARRRSQVYEGCACYGRAPQDDGLACPIPHRLAHSLGRRSTLPLSWCESSRRGGRAPALAWAVSPFCQPFRLCRVAPDRSPMTIAAGVHHVTTYHYDRPVRLGPQVIRLRPAPHTKTRVRNYSLKVTPAEHFVNWQTGPARKLARPLRLSRTDQGVLHCGRLHRRS